MNFFFEAMAYKPNIDAVIFFLENILPSLMKKVPNVHFHVVGRNPTSKLINIASSHSHFSVTGAVKDMRPYYKNNSIFVVPLRSGGGTRLKILEAMAMEMPIVSTRIGAESLKCEDGVNIMITDTPEQFCEKIEELCKNPKLRKRLGEAGRKTVEKYCSWKQIAISQNELWSRLILHPIK